MRAIACSWALTNDVTDENICVTCKPTVKSDKVSNLICCVWSRAFLILRLLSPSRLMVSTYARPSALSGTDSRSKSAGKKVSFWTWRMSPT